MPVQHKRLGAHGALVSNLCLGTMNFGWVTSEEDSFRIMDRALELGINFFDTADVYGWTVEHGTTEEIIGRWFAQGGGRRDAVILATKVYNPVTRKANRPEPNADGRSLSAVKIKKHCEGSLRRLQTDWIDLYQMHHVDRSCPWDETWQGFNSLVQQGKIVYAGRATSPAGTSPRPARKPPARGMTGLVSEQSSYSLNNRMIELEVVPACRHYGLGLIPWSPLRRRPAGRLTGQGAGGTAHGRQFRQAGGEDTAPSSSSYQALCKELGEEPGAVAWPLLHIRPVTRRSSVRAPWNSWKAAVHATEIALSPTCSSGWTKFFPAPTAKRPRPMPVVTPKPARSRSAFPRASSGEWRRAPTRSRAPRTRTDAGTRSGTSSAGGPARSRTAAAASAPAITTTASATTSN